MKAFHFSKFLALLLPGLFWASCEEPCPNGYYGETCEVREYDRFLSDYSGTINCGAVNQLTTLSVVPEPQKPPFDVIIDMEKSSSLTGFKVKAHVLQDTLFIDDQVVTIIEGTDTSKFTFYASRGVLTNDTTLTMQLILSTHFEPDLKLSCNYKLVKK